MNPPKNVRKAHIWYGVRYKKMRAWQKGVARVRKRYETKEINEMIAWQRIKGKMYDEYVTVRKC